MLKRSIINKSIDEAIKFFDSRIIKLPPFGYWTATDWKSKTKEYNEIKEVRLGWDVTDFGSNDFYNVGRIIFTLRNGKIGDSKYKKQYAQK
jgi:D-lyxose ketol-isomerase